MQGGGAYFRSGGSANFNDCNIFNNTAVQVRARFFEPYPSPRWNVTRLIAYFCMQGGGAYIYGSASFINCALYGNQAYGVRARFSESNPSPR